MALYSTMSKEELQAEMDSLQNQGQSAYDAENWSEYEVLMKKWYLAKSYLIRDTISIDIGKTYHLTEEDGSITVTKLEGVMAWGHRDGSSIESAVPIAMLRG
ncbi:DUF1811 family protein [Alicyclobacillus curvatus]|nr:DUF1811 family protein [Alicyclobacillus curvatus]